MSITNESLPHVLAVESQLTDVFKIRLENDKQCTKVYFTMPSLAVHSTAGDGSGNGNGNGKSSQRKRFGKITIDPA